MKKQQQYIIGIDLGTTNCTMAYTRADIADLHASPIIHQCAISQMTDAQIQADSYSLPSFIYHLLPEEHKSHQAAIDWAPERTFVIGTYAKERGAELPSRLVSSAKSWLCHQGIDRKEKILPLNADDLSIKLSPLEACTDILLHLKEAWNHSKPEAPFQNQQLLITVPASFDPSARQMVQEAAEKAGYPEIILLEEPQAAFYSWIHRHQKDWRERLNVGDSVLVVDIGGGTTDFSLISVEEDAGNVALKRLAVGAHLLLGGDNIDLALAYLLKQKFEDLGHELDPWQFQSLIHQSRSAKELLLSQEPPLSVDITLLGRGSRLIGNSLKTNLTLAEVESSLIDQFIPLISHQERSQSERRSGIQQIGLPYAEDGRISAQLAKFLSLSGESAGTQDDSIILPTAVLFNGGTMKASALRERLILLLNNWAKALNKPPVIELPGAEYDFAVSQGAVCYGLARLGHSVRIRGGTSRSYFVGIEESMPAVPGIVPPLRAICIVPFGMEEGEEKCLENQEFALILGEQVSFRFFSHETPKLSNGIEPEVGTVVRQWKQDLTELNPIEAMLDKNAQDGRTIRIKLKSKVTELGVLELWCEAPDGRKWKLEFTIR